MHFYCELVVRRFLVDLEKESASEVRKLEIVNTKLDLALFSSITSQPGVDDRFNADFSRSGSSARNNFVFNHSTQSSTSKEIDQLYTKVICIR